MTMKISIGVMLLGLSMLYAETTKANVEQHVEEKTITRIFKFPSESINMYDVLDALYGEGYFYEERTLFNLVCLDDIAHSSHTGVDIKNKIKTASIVVFQNYDGQEHILAYIKTPVFLENGHYEVPA